MRLITSITSAVWALIGLALAIGGDYPTAIDVFILSAVWLIAANTTEK